MVAVDWTAAGLRSRGGGLAVVQLPVGGACGLRTVVLWWRTTVVRCLGVWDWTDVCCWWCHWVGTVCWVAGEGADGYCSS